MGDGRAKAAAALVVSALAMGCDGSGSDGGAAWLGSYAGSFVSEAVDCNTGEALPPAADTIRIDVIEWDGGIAIDGPCPIGLTIQSATRATVVPSTCDSTLADGTPVRWTRISGNVELDGDELSFAISARTERGGVCDSSSDTFVGTRL